MIARAPSTVFVDLKMRFTFLAANPNCITLFRFVDIVAAGSLCRGFLFTGPSGIQLCVQ